jgi:hypothetical protein
MTSKHTTGPWRATTALGENLVAVYTVRDSDNLPVGRGFNAADTRLMAAAPDMLETLRGILARASNAPHDDPEMAAREFERIMRMAREAIAKAEGRA